DKRLNRRTVRAQRVLSRHHGTDLVTKFFIFASMGFAFTASLLAYTTGVQVFHQLTFSLPELLQEQIWRLFTPIFIYPGIPDLMAILYLGFDMWWLKTFATRIEQVNRGRFLAIFVFVTAALTHLSQAF